MSKRLLILTPNPDHPSHHGRWPYVLDAYREALAGLDLEIFDQPWSQPVAEDYDLILPLVALGLSRALHLEPRQATVLLMFSALPTASSCYVLAARMGYNAAYVGGLVTLSTILGMLSLPFALGLPH